METPFLKPDFIYNMNHMLNSDIEGRNMCYWNLSIKGANRSK